MVMKFLFVCDHKDIVTRIVMYQCVYFDVIHGDSSFENC